MKAYTFYLCVLLGITMQSCDSKSGSKLKPNESEASKLSNNASAIDQTNPTIMIFPSDALMERLGCITSVENQGVISYRRDYTKAYMQSSELKFIIASIEESFSKAGYPLENLEQQLKQINNENSMDAMENISKDARTLLINTARPDFAIELDYDYKQDPMSRNPKNLFNYTITSLDVYSNKSIASITRANLCDKSENNYFFEIIKSDLNKNLPDFENQIKQRFADELANGIEITLRITSDEKVNFNLTDECLGNENYNDWINSWLKDHTVNSAFKPIKNTDKEMRFTNVRISPKNKNGKRYSAFDFANDFKQDFAKGCGVKATNRTQGIGDAYLIITGLK